MTKTLLNTVKHGSITKLRFPRLHIESQFSHRAGRGNYKNDDWLLFIGLDKPDMDSAVCSVCASWLMCNVL